MKKFIVLVITVVMAMSLLSGSLVVLAEEAEQPGCFVDEANDTAIPAEETEPSVESAVVTELPSEAVIADPVVPAAVPENAVIAEPVENAASQVSGNVISTTELTADTAFDQTAEQAADTIISQEPEDTLKEEPVPSDTAEENQAADPAEADPVEELPAEETPAEEPAPEELPADEAITEETPAEENIPEEISEDAEEAAEEAAEEISEEVSEEAEAVSEEEMDTAEAEKEDLTIQEEKKPSSSSVIYNEIDTTQGISTAYIELTDPSTGKTLSLDRGKFSTSTSTISGENGSRTATAGKSNSIQIKQVGDGFTLCMQDPPGEWNYIYITGGKLAKISSKNTESTDYNLWFLDEEGHLYYLDGETKCYLNADGTTGAAYDGKSAIFGGDKAPSGGEKPKSDSDIVTNNTSAPQITAEPEVTKYVFEGQYDQAPVYSVKATLPDGVEKGTINFTWYVNGVAQPVISIEAEAGVEVKNTIQPDTLLDKSYGVYPVYCVVSYTVSETGKDGKVSEKVYSNTSITVNFIVAKGINSNSFLTFSDVHETFTNIGKAVNNIMAMNNDGLIPGLVICTGDWANEHYMGGDETSTNYATTRDVYLKRLAAQVGKIDTVYVSGNHDNGNAAKDATIAAGLGAAADYNGAGVIFDSEVAAEKGGSSKDTKDLIVYGINYENMAKDGGGYSYENIIPDLREYLEKLRENYAGQMVVISAHAGLHKLDDWGGEAAYNIDQSDQMVSLLNEYAKTGMNIMFFFGHDHSRGESELILKPGDTITSTISFEDKTTSDQKVFFTYGHAGYITSNVGGKRRYTEVEWTDLEQPDAVISHTLSTMDKEGALTTDAGLSGEVGAFTDYQFLEKETSWKGDTGKGLTVRANGSIDVFAGVMVDGAVISDDDYAALKGSTIVTLSPAYLKTLANGTHKMKLLFTNGETEEVEFEVQNQEEPDKPEPKPEEPAPVMDQPEDKPAAPAPANAPAGPSIPRTGDDSMQALWLLIMILSLGAVFVAVRKLVRNK